MKTTIINHQQGSEAWHQHRARSFNASELAAVMGMSAYISRSELIKQKVTGIASEIDAQTQRRFDAGHEFEAIARPWAEEIIESDLYPVVLAGKTDGLSLSASLDGLTMTSDISWEHKTGRADLLASLEQGVIPDEYHPQMEMGLMLSGAEKCLFMASSGDKDAMRWVWYLPNLELRAKIIPTWTQFAIDLAAYVPVESVAKPVGRSPETLPALRIEVTGMVTASNLAEYKAHALSVFGGINRELVTDQDFASAESTVKWCSDIEARLAAAKQHALSQTESIDDLFRTIDDISAEARTTRLELDRLVKARKETIRAEIVSSGRNALADHLDTMIARVGNLMPSIPVDFAAAIKGKRTLESMRDAVAVELARAKIAANEIAECISSNLRTIDTHPEHAFLFNDIAAIVLKHPEDLQMLVKSRIADHKAAEAAKEEATRARIRAEEQAKAEREAAEKASKDAIARAQVEAQKPAPDPMEPAPVATKEVAEPAQVCESVQVASASKPKTDAPPTLPLGEISRRFGFNVTSVFLTDMGFEASTVKTAKLYQEDDFFGICQAVIEHIKTVQEQFEPATA